MHFDTWYTFSPQKWITALFFFDANEIGSVHAYGKKLTTEMDYQVHTCTTVVGEEQTMCILSCPTSSIANCKTCTYSADNF
jgi:hypothetical protein